MTQLALESSDSSAIVSLLAAPLAIISHRTSRTTIDFLHPRHCGDLCACAGGMKTPEVRL